MCYLYHSTKIAKGRPHIEEWQTDSSVQKQWSMVYVMQFSVVVFVKKGEQDIFVTDLSLLKEFSKKNQF